MLKIEHVAKSFGKKEVLRDLNLEVTEGSVFGLVGINGAGKSTLLRLIAGVYEPDEGTICLDGKDTFAVPAARRDIVFVADEPYYPIGSTVRSVSQLYRTMYDFDEDAYLKYMKMFDLEESMSILNLSKGMKKRVSLLFGLSVHPKLLLLDEAYDGLEPLARLRFRNVLTERIEDEKISVIISSHNLKELEDVCDSYGILEDGKMLTYGDLLEARERLNRYQIVFEREVTKDVFSGFDILHYEQEGRVVKLVIRGEESAVLKRLEELNPLLLDVLNVSFEELFIYELESRGEIHE